MRKFGNTAGDDLENLISVAGEGAAKLQGELGDCNILCRESILADFIQ